MALLTEEWLQPPPRGSGRSGFAGDDDGSDYLKVYYAGPIRSAGGTAQALSVLVGDYVRQALTIRPTFPPRGSEALRRGDPAVPTES